MRIVGILILFLGIFAINVSGKPAGNRRTILLTDDKIGVKKRNEDSSSGYYLEQCGIVKFPKSRHGVVTVLAFLDSSWPYSHRQAIMLKMLNERLQRSGLPDTLFFVVNVDPYFSRKIDKTEDDIEKEAWLGVSPEEIESFSEIDKTFDSLAKSIDPGINLIQDNEDLNIWKNLRGSRDQVLVIDRCGKLTYQVIVPWSILHFPYVKAAILSTYRDEPCGPCDILDEKAVEEKDDLQMSLGITESLNNDLVTLGDVSGGNSHIYKSVDDPLNITETEINEEASNTSEATFSDFFPSLDNAAVFDATTHNLIVEADFSMMESGTKMNENSTPSMMFAVNFTAEENSSRVIEDYPISSTFINVDHKVDDNPEITDKINYYHGTNVNKTDTIISTTTEMDLDSQTRVVEAEREFVDFGKVQNLKIHGEKYESTDANLFEFDGNSTNQTLVVSSILGIDRKFIASDIENDNESTSPSSMDSVDTTTEIISDFPSTRGCNFKEIFLPTKMGSGSVDSTDSTNFDIEESKSGTTTNDYEITRPTSTDGVDTTKIISDFPTMRSFNFKEIFLPTKMGNGSVDSTDSTNFDTEESKSGTTTNDYEITRPTSSDGVDTTEIISDFPTIRSFNFKEIFLASKMGNGPIDATDSTNFDTEESKSETMTNDYEIMPTSTDGVDTTEIISGFPTMRSFNFKEIFLASKMGNDSLDATDSINFNTEESKSESTTNDYEIMPTSIDRVDTTEIISDFPTMRSFNFKEIFLASKMGNGPIDSTDSTNFDTEESKSGTTSNDYEIPRPTSIDGVDTTEIISDFPTMRSFNFKEIFLASKMGNGSLDATDSTNFDTEESRSTTKDYETTSDRIDTVDTTTQIISDFSTGGFYYAKEITASKMEDTSYDSSTDSTNFDIEDQYFGTAENNPDISVETTKSTLYSNKPTVFTINKEALKNDDPEKNQDLNEESDKVEETLSSYMPIRIIMHAPHFHIDGDSTRMHEYLVLKTRNPHNHGHLSSYDATRLYRGPQDYQEKHSNLTASEIENKEWSMRNLIFNRDESPGLYGEVADYWRDMENPENYEYTEETERPIQDKNEEKISNGDEIFQDKTNAKDSKKIVDMKTLGDHVTDELIPEMQTKEAAEFNAEDEETRSKLIAHYSKLLPWIYYVLDK